MTTKPENDDMQPVTRKEMQQHTIKAFDTYAKLTCATLETINSMMKMMQDMLDALRDRIKETPNEKS